MSSFFDDKPRRVIPNFRSLRTTVDLGEVNSKPLSPNLFIKDDLQNYIDDFLLTPSIAVASDLLSASIVYNLISLKEVETAANYIVANENIASDLQLQIAKKILKIRENGVVSRIDSIEDFIEIRSVEIIHSRIASLKKQINVFSRNPFLYSELARMYSIIGQKDAAIKNMVIARSLAPYNRYILRSFARLLAHFGEFDRAHEVIKRNVSTKSDPWLLASEIALASLRDKTSNFIKISNDILNSNKFDSFNLSELSSSLGTFELNNGSRKKSKDLLKNALVSPNDNSLAQVEWVNNRENFFELDVKGIKVDNNFEALTLDSFDSKDWNQVVLNAEKWFIDMPFAKRPISFGHQAAAVYLDDQETAIKFCKAGLISNPNDVQIINNLAFSYCINNQPTLAFETLNKIDIEHVKDDGNRICLLATTGLAYFRSGFPDFGRELYYRSIKEANESGNRYYNTLALFNIAREELLLDSDFSSSLIEKVLSIDTDNNFELDFMKKKLIELKEKKLG